MSSAFTGRFLTTGHQGSPDSCSFKFVQVCFIVQNVNGECLGECSMWTWEECIFCYCFLKCSIDVNYIQLLDCVIELSYILTVFLLFHALEQRWNCDSSQITGVDDFMGGCSLQKALVTNPALCPQTVHQPSSPSQELNRMTEGSCSSGTYEKWQWKFHLLCHPS